MEYRELPRIVGPDDGGEDPSPRPRRFPLPRHGRLDVRKLATFAMLGLSLAGVMLYVGRQAVDSALTWLHAQPRYQLPFGGIQLPEPPPDCFRGGTAGFLDGVRRNANEPEVLSLLDVDAARLRNAFKSFPWVEEVGEIERPPGGLIVHLKYRRPVARVFITRDQQFVLDREGCVLRSKDIDAGRLGTLIWIVGQNLSAPPVEREGTIWKTATSESPNREALDRGVVQAAKLAGFFLDPARAAEAASLPAVQADVITVAAPKLNRGLFIETVGKIQIHWGRGPGDEEPGELSAAEKWDLLISQARMGMEQKDPLDMWVFEQSRIVYKPYKGSSPPRS